MVLNLMRQRGERRSRAWAERVFLIKKKKVRHNQAAFSVLGHALFVAMYSAQACSHLYRYNSKWFFPHCVVSTTAVISSFIHHASVNRTHSPINPPSSLRRSIADWKSSRCTLPFEVLRRDSAQWLDRKGLVSIFFLGGGQNLKNKKLTHVRMS